MASKNTPDTPAADAAAAPAFDLVVIHPFGGYDRGARITEATEIARVAEDDLLHHCNRVPKQ
jgi:hypothetical protein